MSLPLSLQVWETCAEVRKGMQGEHQEHPCLGVLWDEAASGMIPFNLIFKIFCYILIILLFRFLCEVFVVSTFQNSRFHEVVLIAKPSLL